MQSTVDPVAGRLRFNSDRDLIWSIHSGRLVTVENVSDCTGVILLADDDVLITHIDKIEVKMDLAITTKSY